IESNTGITNLQSNVFFMKEKISGVVFNDVNHNGVRDFGEPGLAGVTVNLNDDTGVVVATTMTDQNGRYSFTDQTGIPGTGNYTVSLVLHSGYIQTSKNPGTISLSRGNLNIDGMNFGVAPLLQATSSTSLQTWGQAGTPTTDSGLDNGFWAT